jgi:predicted lysophospholipase L1 biosynthesis ABC-type transport system permease subunit
VRKFIPDGLDPVGQRIDDADKEENWTRIVGVTGSIRQNIYDVPMAERDWLIDSMPVKEQAGQLSGMSLVMRFDGDQQFLVPALRKAIHDIDPTVPFTDASTMSEIVSDTLVFERMESWLFAIFAALALALALVGLYGLVSHEVEQARRDIGVRMALGASRGVILGMVLRRVAGMLAAGVAAGLILTVLTRKVIGMVIYFEAGQEALGFLALAALLIVAGLLAALIPAARAASVEPMQALRTE